MKFENNNKEIIKKKLQIGRLNQIKLEIFL